MGTGGTQHLGLLNRMQYEVNQAKFAFSFNLLQPEFPAYDWSTNITQLPASKLPFVIVVLPLVLRSYESFF